MQRPLLAVLAATAALAGCGDSMINSRVYFVDRPYQRLDTRSCAQLVETLAKLDRQIADIEAKIARAESGAGGTFVATVVLKPELAPPRAERYAVREAAERKGCPL